MSAATFVGAASRFRCRPFLSGREMAPGAAVAAKGEACLHCQMDCAASASTTSLAEGSIEIAIASAGVELRWACPNCTVMVIEKCLPVAAMSLSAEIARDPLCHRCREAAL